MKKILYILAFFASLGAISNVALAITNTQSVDLEKSSSQYLSITHASSSNLSITDDLTLEAWVKLESQPSNADYYIISKWDNVGTSDSYVLFYKDISGTKSIRFDTAGVTKSVDYELGTDTWNHVAAVYDASAGSVEFFVNGSSVGSGSGLPSSLSAGTADFRIGALGDGSRNPIGFFDGQLDEVRVWSETRNSSELLDGMYDEVSSSTANLEGYWRLNNSLTDETANINDLMNNASTQFSEEPAHRIECDDFSFNGSSGSFSASFSCAILGLF